MNDNRNGDHEILTATEFFERYGRPGERPTTPSMWDKVKEACSVLVGIATLIGGLLALWALSSTMHTDSDEHDEPWTDADRIQCIAEYLDLEMSGVDMSEAPYYSDSAEEFCG